MPIEGLTGAVRALRTAKFKLGYVQVGKRFPHDTDVFVGKLADGVTPEMAAAYGARPIPDAKEEGVLGFGDRLRGMLAWEYDTIGPDDREVVLELLNRSWAASRIRCSGTGGGEDALEGTAWVREPRYRDRLQRAGLLLGERKGGWEAICRGPECPLWHTAATDQDKLPGCHREMRLRFILLHPAPYDRTRSLDDQHPDYMRQLGWIEIATGSWNGAVDVQSGLKIIRALTGGRTALIPFSLRRVARSVTTPEGRVQKHTLLVDHDADEVLIFAGGRPARALLRPAIRRQLAELDAAESGTLGLPPAQYADVEDIQPQPESRRLTAGRAPLADPAAHDRDDALAAAASSPDTNTADNIAPPDTPTVRLLERDELDELKVLCGGTPGQRETLGRYREMLEASYLALGVPADERGYVNPACTEPWTPYAVKAGQPTPSAWATTKHRDWIAERLAEGATEGER